MTSAFSLSIQLADEIEKFPIGRCGPSDDPDKQYAFPAEFRDLAVRFVSAVRRVGDPDPSDSVTDLDLFPEDITEAHSLRASLYAVIDALKEAAQDPSFGKSAAINGAFLNPELIIQLKALESQEFDTRKLVKMCEELNDSYARANYISATLLLRAVMNHVPPVFGKREFSQVVAHSGRSVKAVLERLHDARPIADLHTHTLIRKREHLPSKHQIEPYKPGFELLIQEIVTILDQ